MEQETTDKIEVADTETVPEHIFVPHNDKDLAILVLDGECKGTKYTYGVITPKNVEDPERPVLEYHYDVIDNPLECTTEQLHRVTAIILNKIILNMVEKKDDMGYTVQQQGDINDTVDDGETNSTELIDE